MTSGTLLGARNPTPADRHEPRNCFRCGRQIGSGGHSLPGHDRKRLQIARCEMRIEPRPGLDHSINPPTSNLANRFVGATGRVAGNDRHRCLCQRSEKPRSQMRQLPAGLVPMISLSGCALASAMNSARLLTPSLGETGKHHAFASGQRNRNEVAVNVERQFIPLRRKNCEHRGNSRKQGIAIGRG